MKDHLGSILKVIDTATGNVTQELQYDEFGKRLADTNISFQPFGFAGGLFDGNTGLVRFGARDYDPENARWMSKDPILLGGGNSNLFVYASNDPINWIDPTGLSDLVLYPPGDALIKGDSNIPEPPNTFSVGAHGNESSVSSPTKKPIGPAELANLIAKNKSYRKGQKIRLNVCLVGKSPIDGGPSFAQQLADIMGAPVEAPTGPLGVTDSGKTSFPLGGEWKTFVPNGVNVP